MKKPPKKPVKAKSKRPEWVDPDDAPDLSTPEWQAKFAKVPVLRGFIKFEKPKRA